MIGWENSRAALLSNQKTIKTIVTRSCTFSRAFSTRAHHLFMHLVQKSFDWFTGLPVRFVTARMSTVVLVLNLCLRKTHSKKSPDYRDAIVVEKLRFQNFPSTRKRKVGVFKSLRFEERFWKALFLWRSTVDSRPNRSNSAVFSNFSGEVWKLPKKLAKMHSRVQVVIRLSFVYDWFIRWCAFSKQVIELQNQSNPGLLWHKITP